MSMQPEYPVILLVEDNVDDYDATLRSFKKARFDNPVQWCKNGKDAMDYLRHHGKYENTEAASPALILLDLNMPGLDGKKTLELIKKEPDLRQIPVVILTTSADEKDVAQCYHLGASTYIQKPVDFEGLVQAISRIKDYWFGIALLPKEVKNDK